METADGKFLDVYLLPKNAVLRWLIQMLGRYLETVDMCISDSKDGVQNGITSDNIT